MTGMAGWLVGAPLRSTIATTAGPASLLTGCSVIGSSIAVPWWPSRSWSSIRLFALMPPVPRKRRLCWRKVRAVSAGCALEERTTGIGFMAGLR